MVSKSNMHKLIKKASTNLLKGGSRSRSSKVSSRGNKCPGNTFSFGSSCLSFMYVLSLICLGASLLIVIIYVLDTKNNNNFSSSNHSDRNVNYNSNDVNNDDKQKNVNVNLYIKDEQQNSPRLNRYDQIHLAQNQDHEMPNVNRISYPNYIHQKAHQRLINPLLPPERSYQNSYGIPINIETRGNSGGYQQIGSLYKEGVMSEDSNIGNNTSSVILPLYGKPVYPGSNKWLYYTTSDKYNMVKLPFSHNGRKCDSDYGCDELYDGDIVQLPAYNGSFKVSVYQLDKPRYIPYVY